MFDTALLESGPSRKVSGAGTGLPLAIAAHLAVIGAFLGASAWKVGDPAEPETRIAVFPTFTRLALPPPPSGGRPAPVPQPLKTKVLSQPTSIPPDVPAPEQDSVPPGRGENGVAEEVPGVGSGSGPGIPGGTGDGAGTLPGEPGEAEPILHPGGDVTFPELVSRVEPLYPEVARRVRLEGILILEAVITTGGEVQDVRVLKSAHPLLDAAASEAVRRWRYRPAMRNGRAVPVYLTVTVTFGLKS